MRFRRRRLMKKLNTALYVAIFFIAGVIFWNVSSNRQATVVTADVQAKDKIEVAATNTEDIYVEEDTEEVVEEIEETTETDIEEEESESNEDFSGVFFIVNLDSEEDYLNIRKEASTDSEILGKLYGGAGGTVIAKGDEWTEIQSGDVTGFVKNEYILYGEEAKVKAAKVCGYVATINEDCLRVREDASSESQVVGLAAEGDTYSCDNVSDKDTWVAINFDGKTSYVSADYVTVELNVKTAVSEAQEAANEVEAEAQEQAEAEAEEEAVEVEVTSEETVDEVVSYETAETETQEQETTTETNAVDATTDDVTLLSALVYCEAGGESYEGKLAVASVVVNRVNSGSYGNSISAVIYAKGQFGPATNGALTSALANGVPSDCKQAATEALSGVNNVPGCYSFAPVSSVSDSGYTVIGNHAFY